MSEGDIIAIMQDGIRTALIMSGPVLAIALLVGLIIAFVQALTQVQEMTLTFVPKIVAILLATLFALPFMYMTLATYAERVFDYISTPMVG